MERARPVLMIVHAHPDDESSQTGGTLARYAAAGCHTILVTCTDGAQGDAVDGGAKPGENGHDPRVVAEHRAGELDAAAGELGIVDVVKLGYPDSGVTPSDGPGESDSFSARPLTPMVQQMVRLMRMYQPDVVITYPPNGLSGHPDHVRTHHVVASAHGNVVANAEPGGRTPRLYYIALSVSRIREMQAVLRAAFGDDAWVPPDELGTDDAEITTVLDVAAFWEQKKRALAAHASQPDAAMLLAMLELSHDNAVPVARVEEYVRAYPPVADPEAAVERDFFAAVSG
jgi:LmbE family N-acetylglucosaminyl deacetylase